MFSNVLMLVFVITTAYSRYTLKLQIAIFDNVVQTHERIKAVAFRLPRVEALNRANGYRISATSRSVGGRTKII